MLGNEWVTERNNSRYGFDYYQDYPQYKTSKPSKPQKLILTREIYVRYTDGTTTYVENYTELTDEQKQYIESYNQSNPQQPTDPKDSNFYENVKLFPSSENMMDTQDILRTLCGGPRSFYGQPLTSIPRTIKECYSSGLSTPITKDISLFNLLRNIGKYVIPGPDGDMVTLNNNGRDKTEQFKNTYNIDPWIERNNKPFIWPQIINDNPATMLAHYFINDFDDFKIFNNPPRNRTTIRKYVYP